MAVSLTDPRLFDARLLDPEVQAALAVMLAEGKRQALPNDPLRTWQPTLKQKPFIESVLHPEVSGYWENWFVGGNRIGKTKAGAYCGAMFARFGMEPRATAYSALPDGTTLDVRDRATAGWVFGLDSNLLRDIIQPCYFDNGFLRPGQGEPFIPSREIQEWRPGDQVAKLWNGSFIGYKSCEAPALKSSGIGIDWAQFDEPPPQRHYDEATIRVSGGRRLRIFGTATILPPEGHIETISWLYSVLIAPILGGARTDIGLFTASIYDNPYLEAEEITRLESRYPVGSLQRRIRLNGELLPGVVGAVAYGNFSRGVHVRPQPLVSPYRPLRWCIDFNVQPFCSVVCQREPGLLRVHREVVVEEGSIEDLCEAFKRVYPAHPNDVWIYGDATGGNRTAQTAKSSYVLILEHLRNYPSRVRLKVPEANPLVVDRVNAVNVALRDELGAAHLVIDPSCVELIADFEQVLSDPRGGIRKSYNLRDAYSKRTGTSDAIGYEIAAEAPVRMRSSEGGRRPLPLPDYGARASLQAGYGTRR